MKINSHSSSEGAFIIDFVNKMSSEELHLAILAKETVVFFL